MRTITKAEFLDYYESGTIFDVLVTPIAILGKVHPDPANPKPEIEVVIVNLP